MDFHYAISNTVNEPSTTSLFYLFIEHVFGPRHITHGSKHVVACDLVSKQDVECPPKSDNLSSKEQTSCVGACVAFCRTGGKSSHAP